MIYIKKKIKIVSLGKKEEKKRKEKHAFVRHNQTIYFDLFFIINHTRKTWIVLFTFIFIKFTFITVFVYAFIFLIMFFVPFLFFSPLLTKQIKKPPFNQSTYFTPQFQQFLLFCFLPWGGRMGRIRFFCFFLAATLPLMV